MIANRAQLWAEAAVREASGESLWIDDDNTRKEAEAAQSDRMMEDAWEEKVMDYVGFTQKVKMQDILNHALSLAPKDQNKSAQMRVGNILRTRRWKPRVIRDGSQTARYWLHPDHQDYPP